ncbi:MAG: protein kinase [Acidobacteria bacterium]|nr:protein kinase [Acidobacteriota bacterium]
MSVQSLAQTRAGHLWLGTQNGLTRFNGETFRTYSTAEAPQLGSDSFWALGVDARDRVWAWADGGNVTRFDGHRLETVPIPGLDFESTHAGSFAAAPDGSVYFGTNNGLFRFRDGLPPARIGVPEGLPGETIGALCVDRSGTLWISLYTFGLAYLRNGRVSRFAGPLPGSSVMALDCAPGGDLWVCMDRCVHVLRDGRVLSTIPAFWPGNSRVTCLRVDRDGNLWVGTNTSGLYRYREGRVERLSTADGLPVNTLNRLLEDQEGNLWVGTNGGGLLRLRDGIFTPFTRREGVADPFCWMVCPGAGEAVWFGTNSGLASCSPAGIRNYGQAEGVPEVAIRSGFLDADGTFWFGGWGYFGSYRDQRFSIFGEAEGLPFGALVSAILRDEAGTLWVGTNGNGLFTFRDRKLVPARMPGVLPNAQVRAIVRGGDGRVWFGLSGIGLALLKNGQWTLFDRRDGIRNLTLFSILEDPDGTLWFCGKGIHRYRDGKFTWLGGRLKVPDEHFLQIVDDREGNLWLTSLDGIVKVPRAELHALADGRIPTLGPKVFGVQDGMPVPECNGANQSAGCRTPDGRLWFPTPAGVVTVRPRDIPPPAAPPRVRIEECRVDSSPVVLSGEVPRFPPGTSRLDFQFTGLCLSAPESVRYRYRLDGFDEGWQDSGPSRNASYTRLAPGAYCFRVSASRHGGPWNGEETRVRFEILPQVHQTLWFQVLVILAAAVGLNFLYRGGRRLSESFRFWRQDHSLGPYRLLERIGQGGAGSVYRARDRRDGKTVALKVLHESQLDAEALRRLATESKVMETVRHPNIARIHEQGRAGDRVFIAMEHVEGVTLRQVMAKGRQTVPQALAVFRFLLDVLDELHALGVAHRDLKPENLMVKASFPWDAATGPDTLREGLRNNLKILDFGTARFLGGATLTRTGEIAGTVYYLPPESILGRRVSGVEQDVYALGMILYELLAGRRPYDAADEGDLIAAIVHDPLPPPGVFQFDIPAPVSDFVAQLIDRNPSTRLKTPEAIRAVLDTLPGG